jgi:hypothetical protein
MTLFAAFRWEVFFLNPAVVWVLIPVTAIIFGGAQKIYEQYCRHQERLEMIQNGIHPDLETVEEPITTEYYKQQA